MAKQVETIVTLTDDLDGSKAERTISFAFDGVSYEIDLSKKNAAALEEALRPYVAAARNMRPGGRRRGSRTGGRAAASAGRRDLSAVRHWAQSNGYDVSDRGRIPAAVLADHDAAQ